MPLSLQDHIARGAQPVPEDGVLLGRAALLPPEDRDLLLAIHIHRQPIRLLAKLSGLPLGVIRWRFHRAFRRIGSREFLAAARVLRSLDEEQARVARLRFFAGLSERATARAAGLSYHRTRQVLGEIRALIRGAGLDRPRTGGREQDASGVAPQDAA